jgi:hypothetical protein
MSKTAAPGPFQFKTTRISDGMAGIYFEIKKMKEYVRDFCADPTIIEFTRSLVLSCPPKDLICEIETIHRFTRDHVRFVQDPVKHEVVSTPVRMLREVKTRGRTSGDCDEIATLTATLLASIGIEPRFRFGGEGSELFHVWVQADINGHGLWGDLESTGYLDAGKYYAFPKYAVAEIFD